MPWLILAALGIGTYFVGKARCWWACDGFTCDIESDMPDALKTQVLAQAASATNPAILQAFAVTLYQAGYIQSAYCLADRAWILNGSHGTAPIAPTLADIANAQKMRATALAAAGTTAGQAAAAAGGSPSPAGGGLPPSLINALTNLAVSNLGQTTTTSSAPAAVAAASPTPSGPAPAMGETPPPGGTPNTTGSAMLPVTASDMEVGSVRLPTPFQDMEVGRAG